MTSAHRLDVAIRRIAEFDFDSHWNASDVSLLADDAMVVVGELRRMREVPKENKCVCGQRSQMFTSDMDWCPACKRQWYV